MSQLTQKDRLAWLSSLGVGDEVVIQKVDLDNGGVVERQLGVVDAITVNKELLINGSYYVISTGLRRGGLKDRLTKNIVEHVYPVAVLPLSEEEVRLKDEYLEAIRQAIPRIIDNKDKDSLFRIRALRLIALEELPPKLPLVGLGTTSRYKAEAADEMKRASRTIERLLTRLAKVNDKGTYELVSLLYRVACKGDVVWR